VKSSGVITLTTDFGLHDPYVAMMKGAILTVHPGARLIDVTHLIDPGAVAQAAGLVRDTFPFFPAGTVHVVVVDPGVGSARRPIAVAAAGHFFVGPDNGLFWPIIEAHAGATVIHMTEACYFRPPVSKTFHGRDLFAPAAAHLSLGVGLEQVGAPITDTVRLLLPAPQRKGGSLVGQIVRIDHFGNLITNIHRSELERFLMAAPAVIEVGHKTIEGLRQAYTDVRRGELLALMDSSDYLEIAVNMGRAAKATDLNADVILGSEVIVKRRRGKGS
jgi:S-adenosylmethionine hydrolase